MISTISPAVVRKFEDKGGYIHGYWAGSWYALCGLQAAKERTRLADGEKVTCEQCRAQLTYRAYTWVEEVLG